MEKYKIPPQITNSRVEIDIFQEYENLEEIIKVVKKHGISSVVTMPKYILNLMSLRSIRQATFNIISIINYPIKNTGGIGKFNNMEVVNTDGCEICFPELKTANAYYVELHNMMSRLRQPNSPFEIRFAFKKFNKIIIDAIKELKNQPDALRFSIDEEDIKIEDIEYVLKNTLAYVKIKIGKSANKELIEKFEKNQRIVFSVPSTSIVSLN